MIAAWIAAAAAQEWAAHPLPTDGDQTALAGGPGGPDDGFLLNGWGSHWYPSAAEPPLETLGFFSVSVALADQDGDGLTDLLVEEWACAGADRFATCHAVADDLYPNRSADLDGDGDPDLIGNLGWWETAGGVGVVFHPSEPGWQSVGAFDVDQDGDLDLYGADGAVWGWRANDGAATFGPPAPGDFVYALAAPLDLDGDGDGDLAFTEDAAWREALPGGLAPTVALVPGARLVTACDLDGDGVVDLVLKRGRDLVARAFDGVAVGPERVLARAPVEAACADADGDGDLDLALANGVRGGFGVPYSDLPSSWAENPGYPDADRDGLANAAEVALGTDPDLADSDGDGLDDRAERWRWHTDPTDPRDADTIDADGDGLDARAEAAAGTDPARGDSDADGLWDGAELRAGADPGVPDSDGDGAADGLEDACGSDPTDSASIDADCDGLDGPAERAAGSDPEDPDSDDDGLPDGTEVRDGTDPTRADTDGGGVDDGTERGRRADPTYAADDWPARALSARPADQLRVGDLDGDGAPDLVVRGTDGALAALVQGPGGFTERDLGFSGAGAFALADLDGDGAADLVSDGSVAWGPALGPEPAPWGPTGSAVPVDADADGDLDVVVAEAGVARVVEHVGGDWWDVATFAAGPCEEAFAVETVAGALPDVWCRGPEALSVWEAAGPLRFAGSVAARGALDLGVADLDADGDADAAWAAADGLVLAWTRWGAPEREVEADPQVPWPGALALADLDGDGAADLVSVGWSGLAWRRRGPGGFGAEVVLDAAATDVTDLRVLDLDGDGDRDVVTASPRGVVAYTNGDPCYADADGDGVGGAAAACGAGAVRAPRDCDDADPARTPGAYELCDGRDDDCTGLADDPVDTVAWYVDGDGDLAGDGAALEACVPPAGHARDRGDCDDADPDVGPVRAEVTCNGRDDDCAPATPDAADRDADGEACPQDCDDADPGVRPGAPEACDGRDQDCDGAVDEDLGVPTYVDADGDGVGGERTADVCAPGPGLAAAGGDCDDADPARTSDCADPPVAAAGGGGCGCNQPSPGPGLAAVFAALVLLRRRSRPVSPRSP